MRLEEKYTGWMGLEVVVLGDLTKVLQQGESVGMGEMER